MPFLSFPPALSRPRPDRVDLTVPPIIRLLYIALGVVLIVVLARALGGNGPLIYMFAIVIGLAALAEDRWIFDAGSSEVRRRFGLLLVAKSWAIDLNEVLSVELDSEADEPTPGDPYNKIGTSGGRGMCALRLVLADGRTLTMYALPRKHLPILAERGRIAAESCGKPFIET